MIYTAKVLLDQLMKRSETKKVKSAMIITGSVACTMPASGITTYCATKKFVSYMAEGLHHETAGLVDIMSYEPANVATKMIGRNTTDVTTISPERAADVMCRDIGYERVSNGVFMHEFTGWMMGCFSQPMVSKGNIKNAKKYLEVFRENNEK